MKRAKMLWLLVLILCLINVAISQQVEHYSLESAILEKDHARTLILNLNDTLTSPSLEGIGSLRKLKIPIRTSGLTILQFSTY
jgi:hypothetical protein